MKNILLLFILLIPAFLFAQYPATGNKQRLGYQTTGDGLIWRGVAADTAIKPRTINNAYFQLDTVNRILRRYIATQGSWQVVGSTPNLSVYALKTYVDSLYATDHDRDSTNEIQTLSFASPLLAISDGNNVDLSPILSGYVTGSGTNNRVPKWSATSNLTDSNIQDNGTAVSILSSKPFLLGQWTTAGRPSSTDGYIGRNTTTGFDEGYFSSEWRNYITSTGATTNQVSFFGSAGSILGDAGMVYDATNNRLGINLPSGLPGNPIEIYTTTNADLIKLRSSTASNATLTMKQDGYNSWVTGHILNLSCLQSGPTVTLRQNALDAVFVSPSASNTNLRSNVNIGFNLGFIFTAGSERIFYGIAPNRSYIGGFDAGIDFGIYDHRSNQSNLNKSATQFRLAPSKETWIGDEAVDNNFSFYVRQPRFGYGNVNTTNGSTTITGFASSTFFTKDFNIGTTLTINGSNFTVTAITNDFTATVTPAPTFTGNYDYNITNSNTRLGVYKNGGVIINQSPGQTRYELQVSGKNGLSIPQGTTSERPTWVTATTPIRYNTDSSAAEIGIGTSTWNLFASRAYARSLVPTTFYTGDGTLSGNRMVNLNKKTLQYSNNAFFSIYSDQTSGTWGSSFELDTFSRTYQYRYTDDTGEPRYVLGHARGTRSSPTSLQKLDRTGGYYFQAYYNGAWRKTGVMLGEIDSISGSSFARGVIRFSVADNNFPETTGADQLRIAKTQVTTRTNHVVTGKLAVGYGFVNTIDPTSSTTSITHQLDVVGNAQITGKTVIGQDSTLQYDPATDLLRLTAYGTSATTAAALSKTLTNYGIGFATDGTVTSLEIKRDTTIFVTADTDYDFSAAVTTAQISRRYNRVIIHMTLTSGVGADKTTTLHAPDVNLMQCEILIRGTDNTATYDNEINFGTNNAISSDGTNTSGYTLAQGQGLHVRVVYNGSAYKYIYY